MLVLNGIQLASQLKQKLATQVAELKITYQVAPQLVVVMVGDYGPSQVYVRNKIRACSEVGIRSQIKRLPGEATDEQLVQVLQQLNQDPDVDGVLVQFPLPAHLDPRLVYQHLDATKDADAFTYGSVGRWTAQEKWVQPCTPAGIIRLLKEYHIPIAGKRVAILGRSHIVGLPLSILMTHENATVTLCHSKTLDLVQITQQADIVVAAAHQRLGFGREHFKSGVVVVDVGIHPPQNQQQKLCGDVRFEELLDYAAAASPVPGGVGPMTIYMLLENTVQLFKTGRSRC